MSQDQTTHITKATLFPLIVSDQDKSLEFYTERLGFEKKGDMPVGDKRWLTIAAPQQDDVQIISNHRIGLKERSIMENPLNNIPS